MSGQTIFQYGRRRLLIVGALGVAVIAAFALRGGGTDKAAETTQPPDAASAAVPSVLPRLVDLGADKCIPCKMMAPILEELRVQYDGRFEVVFIDVWKDPPKAKEFGITVIPTQILIDPDGKELMRHEGFFAKDDILAAWRTHGYDFPAPPAPSAPTPTKAES